MDYEIFKVRTDVNAWDRTRGCTDTVRESAPKVDWEKNPLLHQEIEPVSAVCRSGALPPELHPHPKFLFSSCPRILLFLNTFFKSLEYITDPSTNECLINDLRISRHTIYQLVSNDVRIYC